MHEVLSMGVGGFCWYDDTLRNPTAHTAREMAVHPHLHHMYHWQTTSLLQLSEGKDERTHKNSYLRCQNKKWPILLFFHALSRRRRPRGQSKWLSYLSAWHSCNRYWSSSVSLDKKRATYSMTPLFSTHTHTHTHTYTHTHTHSLTLTWTLRQTLQQIPAPEGLGRHSLAVLGPLLGTKV